MAMPQKDRVHKLSQFVAGVVLMSLGVAHAFMERLMFPLDTYIIVDGVRQRILDKPLPTAMLPDAPPRQRPHRPPQTLNRSLDGKRPQSARRRFRNRGEQGESRRHNVL